MTQNDSNPYVGPRPFERKAEDAVRFFGRSQETEEIVSLIFGHPVTLVYAQSGAGKTSLFNASVTTNLEENGFDVLPLTRVGGVVPKGILLKEIKNLYIFNALLKMDSEAYPRTLVSTSLCAFLENRVRATDETGQPRPRVIIFDQFEELFTYTPEEWREQRDGFFQQVVEALNADPLLRVVFVIREDFLAELDPYARALPEHLRTRYRLERLGENAALRAIKDPLINTPRKFAPGVAEDLVKELLIMRAVDATGKTAEIVGQYVEPVQLQVVCVTLWSTLETEVTEIEKTHLKNFNVSEALSNFYKSAVEAAAKETVVPETNLRNWFGKTLITPMGTRSTVFRGEDTTGGINNSAVDFLEGRHIIRAEFRAGARWYELTHDRLVEPILASNQKWMETLSPLQRQATLWSDQGKQETWLFSDQALTEVEQWAKEHENELSEVERQFLEECRVHQKEIDQKKELEAQQQKLIAEQKLARQRRIIANVSIVATIVSLALAFFGLYQAKQASYNETIAQTAQADAQNKQILAGNNAATAVANENEAKKQALLASSNSLAAQSNALQEKNFQISMLLGIEAYKNIENTDVQKVQPVGALLDAAQANPRLRAFLNGHTSTVSAVAYSPDGKTLASASHDGNILFWDVKTGTLIDQAILGDGDPITSMAFSPDSKKLASGGTDNVITLWDTHTKQEILRFTGHSGAVSNVAFSPDGDILASASYDGTVILWDPNSASIISTLVGHTSSVTSIAFSHDGRLLASGGFDRTVILWNMTTLRSFGEPIYGFKDTVNSVAFSPDGKILAAGSCSRFVGENCDQGEIILKDLNDLQEDGFSLTGHTDFVTDITFSPDGMTLASSSNDATIILWDLERLQPIGPMLTGHTGAVNSVDFNTDGSSLASGSSDSSIILWDIEPRPRIGETLVGHEDAILTASFSPDGTKLASGSWDTNVILWDVSNHEQLSQLRGHNEAVSAVAFSPDGKNLVATSYDNTFTIWNVETNPTIDEQFTDHTNLFTSIAFSPDGETFVTGSCSQQTDVSCIQGEVIFWNTKTRQSIGEPIPVHADFVSSLAFSPDGRILASSSYDKTIILWDVKNRQPLGQPLIGHSDVVTSVAFSPDGTVLASGSWDSTVILWDMQANPPKGQPLVGHTDAVTSVSFSTDGQTLASGSFDKTIILWDVQTRQPIGQPLTGHTDAITSVAFSPNGNKLASASYDSTIILWDIKASSLIQKSCQRVGRNLTASEWARYLPNREYQKTCPQWSLETETISTPVVTAVLTATPTNTPGVSQSSTGTPTQVSTISTMTTTATVAAPATTPTSVGAAPVLYKVVNVTEDVRLNVRAGPGVKYEIVGKIPKNGTGILKTGTGVQADNTIWYPITYNGMSGWVNSYYLALESDSR